MKKWLLIFLIKRYPKSNCQKTTFLLEKQFETDLSIKQLLYVHLHLTICPHCRLYKQQTYMIHTALKSLWGAKENEKVVMRIDVKERLDNLVHKHLNDMGQ